MPASRNPFYVRTAEQAESDDQFLNLFSLAVLDLLPEDGSWNRFLPIESAPGSGKSTLLRLFTPPLLMSIANAQSRPEFRDLINRLTQIGALGTDGVQLLGVFVNCKEDYSRLAEFNVDAPTKETLFWALLHSRLALLTIRAALQLTNHVYPSDVDAVCFEPRSDSTLNRPDARSITGRELFNRARAAEQLIVDSLNSFTPSPPLLPEGLIIENIFQLFNTHRVLIAGEPSPKHILVMFDDAHLLDDSQRVLLVSELERHDRSAFASWMAMRLRALEPPEIISEAVRPNREGFAAVRFDNWKSSHVETWLLDVGDRRARRAQLDVSSFSACLPDSLETEYDNSKLVAAARAERDRAYEMASPYGDLYSGWFRRTETKTRNLKPHDQASRWAQLQILIQRRIQNAQGEFTFERLSCALVDKAGPDTLEPATIFMSERNELPYFYGVRRIAQLASTNVDQFLALSATLFDRLLNSGYPSRRHHRELPPSTQNRVVLAQSRAYVNGLRTSYPYGQDVSNLIIGIAELCRAESRRPNVPITPGVTGISIQISERDALISAAQASGSQERRVLNAVASAIAHNVLSIRITDRQRDENRAVFYLNRLVCPTFGLPLGFGGYKPQKLTDLCRWVTGETHSSQPRLDI